MGLIDNWLRHIQDVRDRHMDFLAALPDHTTRWRALCELNVIEQVRNVARTTLVGDAWKRRQPLMLHAWIYGWKTVFCKTWKLLSTRKAKWVQSSPRRWQRPVRVTRPPRSALGGQ